MEMHYATLWEGITDEIGDRTAVVMGQTRRSWTDFEQRAARLASAYAAAGLRPDSKIGLYLYNSPEYLEAQFGAFKGRHVPININYRYLDEELLYLLDNSDSEVLVFHSSLGERVARVMDKAPKVKLWIQVDDGGPAVPGAVPFEDLVTGHDPAARIGRSADDVYMLYTGGTTGMPKGVMYDIGGMLQGFINSAFPVFGLGLPQIDEVPALARKLWDEQGRSGLGPRLPPHARHGYVARRHDAALRGRPGGAARRPLLRRPRALGDDPAREGHAARDRGRRLRQADDPRARGGQAEGPALRPEQREDVDLVGRHVDHGGEAAAARLARVRADRRDGQHRRQHGHPDHDPRQRRRDGEVRDEPDDEGLHRGRPARRAGLGRGRHGRGRWQRAPRLLQGRGQVPGHVQDHRRRPLLVPWRLGSRRGGRQPDASRPRLELHQHRRREGLSRGGRGGGEAPRRRDRLPGRRRRRREVRPAGHRGRLDPARQQRHRRGAPRVHEDPARRLQGPEAALRGRSGQARPERQGRLQVGPQGGRGERGLRSGVDIDI